MGSEGPAGVTIHVTGFKKFHGVAENPTEAIVNDLKAFVEERGLPAGVTLGSCTVLDAAGDGARTELYKVLDSGISNMTQTNKVVWLHLGVNSGSVRFAVESQAVNEATFRYPDELGWQPQKLPIVLEDGEISIIKKTSCSALAILEKLKSKSYNVILSDDAGRFVCNYVYYHSLRYAEQKGHKSLFVHVPLFSKIDKETQMRFVHSLLEAIASTC